MQHMESSLITMIPQGHHTINTCIANTVTNLCVDLRFDSIYIDLCINYILNLSLIHVLLIHIHLLLLHVSAELNHRLKS